MVVVVVAGPRRRPPARRRAAPVRQGAFGRSPFGRRGLRVARGPVVVVLALAPCYTAGPAAGAGAVPSLVQGPTSFLPYLDVATMTRCTCMYVLSEAQKR